MDFTTLSESALRAVIDHLFLPPKLPQCTDDDSELVIVRLAVAALRNSKALFTDQERQGIIPTVIATIENITTIHGHTAGAIDAIAVRGCLAGMTNGQCIAMNVAAQNAAVMVSLQDDRLVFEAFELSPRNEAVMTTTGRLIRKFPSQAIAVEAKLLYKHDFIATVAETLSTMSTQAVSTVQEKSIKTGRSHVETREPASPFLVCGLFLSALRGFGQDTKTMMITKHTRDDILWDNTNLPWRRSPMWLLVRVCIELMVMRSGAHQALPKKLHLLILTSVLSQTNGQSMDKDLISIMTAKIARRLYKLQTAYNVKDDDPVVVHVSSVLSRASRALSDRWSAVQSRDGSVIDLSRLKTLQFHEDALISMPILDAHIESIASRREREEPDRYQPTTRALKLDQGLLPHLTSEHFGQTIYSTANLHEVEQWVFNHAAAWTSTHDNDAVPGQLRALIESYHRYAMECYRDNPEGQSVMLLTIFVLWMCSDQAVTLAHPLLADYSCGIPTHAFELLLLPFRWQLAKLSQLEAYITSRCERMPANKLFDAYSADSFPCRYFDKSQHHQDLQAAIKSWATGKREEKRKEYRQLYDQYKTLTCRIDNLQCTYDLVVTDAYMTPPQTERRHSNGCHRCTLKRQRANLSIAVHEWPLPSDAKLSKTVVFELDVPSWYAEWRSLLQYILHQVLGGTTKSQHLSSRYTLSSNDPHLSRAYYKPASSERIGLLSDVKPACNTHYSQKTMDKLCDDDLCPPNGLQYRYFDTVNDAYLGQVIPDSTLRMACTYKPESEPLRKYLCRPHREPDGQSSNIIYANQDEIPSDVGAEAYIERAHIPYGVHLQWLNMAAQLTMTTIDLKSPDTTLVFFQCINQSGPPGSDVRRQAHALLRSDRDVKLILQSVRSALSRAEQNWDSAQVLSIATSLVCRCLSLSDYARDECLSLLATIRRISSEWVWLLKEKADTTSEAEHRKTLVQRMLAIALMCACTFDVDLKYLEVILEDSVNTALLVQMSILIHDGRGDSLRASRLLHYRVHRVLRRSYRLLRMDHDGIDVAVRKLWPAYTRTSYWNTVSNDADHWLVCETASSNSHRANMVHLDLLSGQFLVNGLPLDRPPAAYCTQPLFKTLFGDSIVDVMPATEAGFKFSLRRPLHGQTVQIGLDSAGDLLAQARKDTLVFETIPCRVIQGCFPRYFEQHFVHWFNHANGTIEFRPISQPWDYASKDLWILSRATQSGKWQLQRNDISVIRLSSPTSLATSSILRPLAEQEDIHNLLHRGTACLLIDLPQVRHAFHLQAGSTLLQSREYPGMSVHSKQNVGTLYGLANKLHLRSDDDQSALLLVPRGQITYQQHDDHVSVHVLTRSASRVHAYRINGLLQRLEDTGTSEKLYLAYLHAITSSSLVDPLLHQTGTEQALSILQSAALLSFSNLSGCDFTVLADIARLSPAREYYPSHLKVMQTVKWDEQLGMLSQHEDLAAQVDNIISIAQDTMILNPDQVVDWREIPGNISLRTRSLIRTSTFRVAGFSAASQAHHDECYRSREQDRSVQANKAAIISNLMYRNVTARHFEVQPVDYIWRHLQQYDTIHGPASKVSIQYDGCLLRKETGWSHLMKHLPSVLSGLGCINQRPRILYSSIMFFATLSTSDNANMLVLQAIILFVRKGGVVMSDLRFDKTPLKSGITAHRGMLLRIIEQSRLELNRCPEQHEVRRTTETRNSFQSRRAKMWQGASNGAQSQLASALFAQWPSLNPLQPNGEIFVRYIDMRRVMCDVTNLFHDWHNNALLLKQITAVEENAESGPIVPCALPSASSVDYDRLDNGTDAFVTGLDLFDLNPPIVPAKAVTSTTVRDLASSVPRSSRLANVLHSWMQAKATSRYEQSYWEDLQSRLEALRTSPSTLCRASSMDPSYLDSNQRTCQHRLDAIYQQMVDAVERVPSSSALRLANLWPRVSPSFFLSCLGRARWKPLSPAWKECLVAYGIAVTDLQRAMRLTRRGVPSATLDAELANEGHQNWNPLEHPESLLIEIEGNIMIRAVQQEVAKVIRSPPNSCNTVTQLNMGEGKSSTILPMAITDLADGSCLLRVVVGKPQSKQMAQMLISRLGGLINRRVYYMPFCRSLPLDHSTAKRIKDMLRKCMSEGSVLLVQPEHVLSFKLMCIECHLTENALTATALTTIHRFLAEHARDVIDESDENLSTKFELIYTNGQQHLIDGSPDRWITIQHLLAIVRDSVPLIDGAIPEGVEHRDGPIGSFPRLRVLQKQYCEALRLKVASRICDDGIYGLEMSRHIKLRDTVFTYITKMEPAADVIQMLERSILWTERTMNILFILRGFLACGIIDFVFFEQRWRVNYGLTIRNPITRLAVPYLAKDRPSARSEFSHPDVAITLTLLCFYYQGLDYGDLFLAFSHLVNSDQCDAEYAIWVKDAGDLPLCFKDVRTVNLKDVSQFRTTVLPALRFQKPVIDYFCSHFVFAKECKEFPHKLSASGWDLAEVKKLPTTGFSGTNDSRPLLPLDMQHLDLKSQLPTNARVLEYLLSDDNKIAILPQVDVMSDADRLRRTVMQLNPPVQVILDVGAQVLELSNLEFAQKWLASHVSSKDAAIFVDHSDEICVVDRDGRVDRLFSSPFASRTGACLVFLDECHTRGIDLQLPHNYRAALTLGCKLTKDRIAQAAMRMRQLGNGQTITYIVPMEIETAIRAKCPRKRKLTPAEVVRWTITETHAEANRLMPLWVAQGRRFIKQERLWRAYQPGDETHLSQELATQFLERDAMTLQERYHPSNWHNIVSHESGSDTRLSQLMARCRSFQAVDIRFSALQEEQERELSPEIERERQVERPPKARARNHHMHPDLTSFVRSGVLKEDSEAFLPAFRSLATWKTASCRELALDRDLLVSQDFAYTVEKQESMSHAERYQRSVHWVLTARSTLDKQVNTAVVISPYEANQLFPQLTESARVALHVFRPRCNLAYASMDRLDFYSTSTASMAPISRSLAMKLALFSGQLYISTFDDYTHLCDSLGLCAVKLTEVMINEGWNIDANGFILSDKLGRPGASSGLSSSPVDFLKQFLCRVRRYGDAIEKTHVGQLLQGKLFYPAEFASTATQ